MQVDDSEAKASSIPPGWYPDVHSPGAERYWDGNGWTHETRPMPGDEDDTPEGDPFTDGAADEVALGAGAGDVPEEGDVEAVSLPRPWLWTSVVASFLFTPLGVAGVVLAGKSETAYAAGDTTTGAARARASRGCAIAAIVVALAGAATFAVAVSSAFDTALDLTNEVVEEPDVWWEEVPPADDTEPAEPADW